MKPLSSYVWAGAGAGLETSHEFYTWISILLVGSWPGCDAQHEITRAAFKTLNWGIESYVQWKLNKQQLDMIDIVVSIEGVSDWRSL